MTRTHLVAALALALIACTSKEKQACRSQEKWVADLSERLNHAPEPMTKERLAGCLEVYERVKTEVDDATYQALLDCQIAAKDMDEGLVCLGPVMQSAFDAKRPAELQRPDK